MVAEVKRIAPVNAPEKLRGKISVISGDGFGASAAIARLFMEHGAKVAIMGSEDRVRDPEDFHRRSLARFGKTDILVINAGGSAPDTQRVPKRYPDVFAKDAFHAVKIGLPFLAGGASIVLTTPCLADAGALGRSAQAVYQQAMRYFVRVFSSECSRLGIRVNSVVPSQTAMAADCGRARALVADSIRDVAHATLFLASDESRSITGEEIVAADPLSLQPGPPFLPRINDPSRNGGIRLAT